MKHFTYKWFFGTAEDLVNIFNPDLDPNVFKERMNQGMSIEEALKPDPSYKRLYYEVKKPNMIYNFYYKDDPETVPLNNWVNSICSKTNRTIIKLKLHGLTYAKIADKFLSDSLKIRDIVLRELHKRPRIEEEKYINLFDKVNFTKEEFCILFDKDVEVFNYLKLISIYNNDKKVPFKELVPFIVDLDAFTEYQREFINKNY